MSLTAYLKANNLKAADVAKKANIRPPSISTHLKYEATDGKEGRRLGLELAMRAIKHFDGLTLDDLRPDWVDKLANAN